MGTQARTRFRASNMRIRSTIRSRTRGNLVMGSSTTGCSSWSIRALQAWRTFPLMIMVQAPHTSSRQLASQTTGLTFAPCTVTGWRRTSISAEITFMRGR